MPEHLKIPQSASPVARAGAGDISEKELSRERSTLYSTPTRRVQPAHPKKQLFSAPVNKFTAKCPAPSPNLARIRSCLDEYKKTTIKAVKIGPKAISMEDLTPTKKFKKECTDGYLPVVRSPGKRSASEQHAAARIAQFMVVAAWRRRREDTRCLRKTLEFQVSCSERLRMQVSALKSLLDGDNAKVRLAMRELERLKQLLRDKDCEKNVLEREKQALEQDVCDAEDRASELSIGWRNCRNELDGARAAIANRERALAAERAAAADARACRDHACHRMAILEEEVSQQEEVIERAHDEAAMLRRCVEERQQQLEEARTQLAMETEAREQCVAECASLNERVEQAARERAELAELLTALRIQLSALQAELADTRRQLAWWPRPLTRMLGAARSLFEHPMSLSEAVLWSFIPSRHGC